MKNSTNVSNLNWVFCLASLVWVLCSCQEKNSNNASRTEINTLNLKYAEGFEIEYHKGFKLLRVIHPWKDAQQEFTYILGQGILKEDLEIHYDAFVELPVRRLVCTSTSHLPMLEMLGHPEALIGFQSTSFISSETFTRKAEEGLLTDVGMSSGLNIEKLIELNPQLVINYATGNEFDQLEILKRSGIPYMLNADYMEKSPMGRAEWIKFFAAFFDEEQLADSIFSAIENNYNQMVSNVSNITKKPSVFTGVMYGDTWFLPGGKNYASRFFEDAGAQYIWAESMEDGWLELGFESVYDRASEADYWLGCASFNSLEEIENTDSRYALFDAFKTKNIYNYNARLGKNGGNSYLELGYARPDIILSDLIHILHPELMPDHELFFYKALE